MLKNWNWSNNKYAKISQHAHWSRKRQLFPDSAESWHQIDRQIICESKTNKIADRLGKNFDVFLIQRLKESARNENIQQSTNPELKVWMSKASNNGWNEIIESPEKHSRGSLWNNSSERPGRLQAWWPWCTDYCY